MYPSSDPSLSSLAFRAVHAALELPTVILILLAAWVIGLTKVVADLRRRVRELESASRRPAEAAAHSAVRSVRPETEDPLLLAAIAAAIQTALEGTPHRIVHVAGLPGREDWSIEGRRQIHASHVRR